VSELAAAGVPAGPVLSPQQVLDDPHIATALLDHATVPGLPDGAPVAQHPVRLSASEVRLGDRAPGVGEHTDAVLGELGYSSDEVAAMRADGDLG
jgi:crotonobetainyl-CoA:carnitine CoA-transferase CaiB-like acyl-CoA transferase